MNAQIQMPQPEVGLRRSALGILCAVLAVLTPPASATTRTWLGSTALWSNPGNWSPNGVPQNNDSLVFPDIHLFGQDSMNNDLSNLTLDTITFNYGGYSLNGNALTFIQGITDNHSAGGLNRVNCPIGFTSGGGRFNTLSSGQLEISGTTTLANNQDLIVTALEANVTVSGVIQGSGSLVKRGEGALFLRGSANNNYSGPTRVEGGAVHLAKTSAARAISPNVFIDGSTFGEPSLSDDLPGQYPPLLSMTMTNGGDWFITNGATVTNLTMASFNDIEGPGLLTLQCDVSVSYGQAVSIFSYSFISCPIYLGDQTRTFTVKNSADGTVDFNIDGQIIGPGPGAGSSGIIKKGSGQMILTAANTYFGQTLIQGGELTVSVGGALGGTGAGAETIVDGGDLKFSGTAMTVPEPLFLTGGDIVFEGSTTLTGPVVISNFCRIFGNFEDARLEIASAISGPERFALFDGILRLSGSAPNTFGNATPFPLGVFGNLDPLFRVSRATLELAKPDNVTAVPIPVAVSAVGTSEAVLRNFQNGGVSEVRIDHGGSWQLNGHTAAPSALTFTGDGFVDTQGGLLRLTHSDTNQLRVIRGFQTNYTAGISGRVSCEATTNIFLVESNLFLNVAARVSGVAEIVKEGAGTLRLSSSNSFTGPITVNEGTLTAAHTFALGTATAGTFVNRNGSLALDGGFNGIEIAGETLTLDSTNAAALTLAGLPVTNTWSGNIVLQRTAGINVPDVGGALTHFGGLTQFDRSAISGPGGFTKSGPGAMFISGLSGGNTYTGPTTITEGLLHAMRRSRSLSDNITVTGANSVLRTGRTAGLSSVFTVLPVGASMTVDNGGLWEMSPTNSETIRRLLGDGQLATGTGGVLTVSNAVLCEFSGTVSGTGALNKRGLAALRVTGQSPSYTGPATVFDGTYKVDGYFAASPVTVKNSSILRGSGAVGDVTVENGGAVRVDPSNPGHLGGAMQFSSVDFQTGGVLAAGFFGPAPTGGNDFLYVLNGVTLNNSALSIGFQYPPHEGDVVTLVQKIASGAVSGTFSSFPEGTVRNISQIPVVISYVGGNGNDVTLTVTNLPLRGGGSQIVSGLGGNAFAPNDCSQLWLVVTNGSATTATGLHGFLRSLTPGVVVTIAESAYPNLAPNTRGSNATPFQIRTETNFPCGGGVQLELVLTASNLPPTAILYTFPGRSGDALQFDGRDDKVEVAANTFSSVVNNFTIELWANPTGNRTETAETNAGMSGVSMPQRQFQRFAVFPDRGNLAYGPTHVGAGLSIGGNGISVYEQGTNYLPSRLVYSNAVSGWTHVALVYSSRRPQLYVNGALVRSSSVASPFSSVHPSGSLGGSTQGTFGNFAGQLDEVRIWNTALSQAQIQSNMTHSLTGTEPNLVTYFRCDEGGGSLLTDSAPASPNPTGTLAGSTSFVFPGVLPFGPDCNSSGGACESCLFPSGTFTTNTPTLPTPLGLDGSPSLCFPPKPCPGPFPIALPPTRFIQHTFSNSGTNEVCATAQLHFECPVAPQGALHVAAYLGTVDPNDPCLNYLGDSGGDGTAPFAFHVPAGSNVVLLVTQRVPDFGCDSYTLEVFGLPCPPPRLDIARDNAPNKVLLRWSSAYPDYRLQFVNSINGPGPFPFTAVSNTPALLNGKFSVTNTSTAPRQFFRLSK